MTTSALETHNDPLAPAAKVSRPHDAPVAKCAKPQLKSEAQMAAESAIQSSGQATISQAVVGHFEIE